MIMWYDGHESDLDIIGVGSDGNSNEYNANNDYNDENNIDGAMFLLSLMLSAPTYTSSDHIGDNLCRMDVNTLSSS